jgi:transposase
VVSFSPMSHWADQKIRAHVFYCMLALAIAKLMVREVQQSGLDLSVPEMLSSLAGIQETVLLYKADRGRLRARRMITEMDPTQCCAHPLKPPS